MSFGAVCFPSFEQFFKNVNTTKSKESFPAAGAFINIYYNFDTIEKVSNVMAKVINILISGGFDIADQDEIFRNIKVNVSSEKEMIECKDGTKYVLGMW